VEERRVSEVPAWFPAWAGQLADLYFSRTTCLFILHGNVHDLIAAPVDSEDGYLSLPEFLASQVFGSWDVVLRHDLGKGLRPEAAGDADRLKGMVQGLAARLGEPGAWPREPEKVLPWLDRFIESSLLEEEPGRRRSIGLIFEYAQYLVPSSDLDSLARGYASSLVRFLSWAQNPYIKRANVAFVLVAERLSEMNERLVQNPHVAAIEVPMPDKAERERFSRWFAAEAGVAGDFAKLAELGPAELAEVSSGLSLVDLNVLLSQAKGSGRRVDGARFRQLKKTTIERQCRGLLEFVEPSYTLDLVVGQEVAKARLREDAELMSRGRLDCAPMGYLLCGPVGTGKTFLAECYAGSIGIPCVKLRNFRSKYVGETEGNLEAVLTVLRSLGPVIVVIDEADAALGDRDQEGDSGTSSRVFAMIAAQMGDTRFRGRIIWMLLTARPDLLPIDLKRQGRAEVHIPLFYPTDEDEIRQMFVILARKLGSTLSPDEVPPIPQRGQLSGADIEGIVGRALRKSLLAGQAHVTREALAEAVSQFMPSTQGLERELQETAAMIECTDRQFLPEWILEKIDAQGGRARLQERLTALKQLVSNL
jgi:AAA+ superfamily predicted ATPase